MSDSMTVYWANVPDGEGDWSITFEDPSNLIHELSINKNKNNPDDNFLRCPAIINLGKNLFVIKSPLNSSASFIIEDGKVSTEMEGGDGKWIVNRPPSLSNQLIASFSHPIIFFAEEDLDVMVSDPYFSNAHHKSWGTIIPGTYNCGSWFRPIHMEFNVWPGITNVSLKEGEHLAYIKFFTDKNVVLKRFTMTDQLLDTAKICSSAGWWESRVPLAKRYARFKQSKRDKFVINIIKNNIL
jgi:hypothetical protein